MSKAEAPAESAADLSSIFQLTQPSEAATVASLREAVDLFVRRYLDEMDGEMSTDFYDLVLSQVEVEGGLDAVTGPAFLCGHSERVRGVELEEDIDHDDARISGREPVDDDATERDVFGDFLVIAHDDLESARRLSISPGAVGSVSRRWECLVRGDQVVR